MYPVRIPTRISLSTMELFKDSTEICLLSQRDEKESDGAARGREGS
jgi:hypothetical protein